MLNCVSKLLTGAALFAMAPLFAFAPARAVPVAVTYDINLTYFSPAAGANVLQGPGTLTVAFANGTSGGHVGAGSLHVLSGSVMLDNTFTVIVLGNPLMFSGMQTAQFGSGMGAATAGGLFNLATVGHITMGFAHCSGALCGFAGFTSTVPMNLTSGTRGFAINGALVGFPSVSMQTFMAAGTGGMTPNGGIFQVTATGQEVSRQIVPEPGTGLLLGCGLAGFGIALTYWRRRRA